MKFHPSNPFGFRFLKKTEDIKNFASLEIKTSAGKFYVNLMYSGVFQCLKHHKNRVKEHWNIL